MPNRSKQTFRKVVTPPLTVAERLSRILSGKEQVSVLLDEAKAAVISLKGEIEELNKLMGR